MFEDDDDKDTTQGSDEEGEIELDQIKKADKDKEDSGETKTED